MASEIKLKNYRIFTFARFVSVQHITCSLRHTGVIAWPDNVAGGMPMDEIMDWITKHHKDNHSDGED